MKFRQHFVEIVLAQCRKYKKEFKILKTNINFFYPWVVENVLFGNQIFEIFMLMDLHLFWGSLNAKMFFLFFFFSVSLCVYVCYQQTQKQTIEKTPNSVPYTSYGMYTICIHHKSTSYGNTTYNLHIIIAYNYNSC